MNASKHGSKRAPARALCDSVFSLFREPCTLSQTQQVKGLIQNEGCCCRFLPPSKWLRLLRFYRVCAQHTQRLEMLYIHEGQPILCIWDSAINHTPRHGLCRCHVTLMDEECYTHTGNRRFKRDFSTSKTPVVLSLTESSYTVPLRGLLVDASTATKNSRQFARVTSARRFTPRTCSSTIM